MKSNKIDTQMNQFMQKNKDNFKKFKQNNYLEF